MQKHPDKFGSSQTYDGMHKGEDTALYLCKGFRVIGIEADPELVEICRKRFINEINSGQLKII